MELDVPKSGSGVSKWCLEPFITALLHPQGCFVARPNTTTVHEGCALGNVCNVSIDLGFNCLASGRVNTYIMHRSTGVLYPLALEVSSSGQPTGTPDPAMERDDEISLAGVTGSPSYLWRHTGCPGPYGTGCFKLSINQNESKCKRSTRLRCHLNNASNNNPTNSSKTFPYHQYVFIRHWHRVSHTGAEDQIKLARDRTVAWLNGIEPVTSA